MINPAGGRGGGRRVAGVMLGLLLWTAAAAMAEETDDGDVPPADEEPRLWYGVFEIPRELEDPERWRFTPSFRMPRGDFFDRLYLTTYALPVLSFEPALGTGGGLALVDLDFRHQGRVERLGVIGEYTTQGQQTYLLSYQRLFNYYRTPDGVFREERNRMYLRAGYTKPRTLRYYGVGDETEEDDESSYTDEQVLVEAGVVASLPDPTSNFLLDVGLQYETHRLGDGLVEDEPVTADAFPQQFAIADKGEAARVSLSLTYDTRDSFANPYSGVLLNARAALQPFETRDLQSHIYGFSASWAVTTPPLLHEGGRVDEWNPPTDVLAAGLNLEWIDGDAPIFLQRSLGGPNVLRGYIRGRWHGRAAANASIEYRPVLLRDGFPLPWLRGLRVQRVGLVLFVDAGAVADEPEDLLEADWKYTPGVGLRMMLERDAPLRLDVGFSSEGTQLAIQFGQAF